MGTPTLLSANATSTVLLQVSANAEGSSCQARSSRASTRQSPAMPATEHRVAYLALSADASVAYWTEQVQWAIDAGNLTVLCIAVVSTPQTVGSPTIRRLIERVSFRGYDSRIHGKFATVWDTNRCKCENFQLVSIVREEDVQTFTLSLATEHAIRINCANATCAARSICSYTQAIELLVPRPCLIGGMFDWVASNRGDRANDQVISSTKTLWPQPRILAKMETARIRTNARCDDKPHFAITRIATEHALADGSAPNTGTRVVAEPVTGPGTAPARTPAAVEEARRRERIVREWSKQTRKCTEAVIRLAGTPEEQKTFADMQLKSLNAQMLCLHQKLKRYIGHGETFIGPEMVDFMRVLGDRKSRVYRWTPHKRQLIGIVDRGFKLGSRRWKGQDGAREAETLPEAIPGVEEVYVNSEVLEWAGSNAKHYLGRLKQIVDMYAGGDPAKMHETDIPILI